MSAVLKRTVLLVVLAAVFMVALAGVAYAAPTLVGTNDNDFIKGASKADTIYGLNGFDEHLRIRPPG
jgi:cbb3-type cytochrome oxidase cytochrome c subunit